MLQCLFNIWNGGYNAIYSKWLLITKFRDNIKCKHINQSTQLAYYLAASWLTPKHLYKMACLLEQMTNLGAQSFVLKTQNSEWDIPKLL